MYVYYLGGTDLFTIKIHGGGHFDEGSCAYVGGGFRYVDNCDIDEMSILELDKLPHIEGVFTMIDKDGDVLTMCSKLDSKRLVHVYVVTCHIEQTQTYCPSQEKVNYE